MGELVPIRPDLPAPLVEDARRREVELRRELAALRLLNAVREHRARGWHRTPMTELRELAEAYGLDPTTLTRKDRPMPRDNRDPVTRPACTACSGNRTVPHPTTAGLNVPCGTCQGSGHQ